MHHRRPGGLLGCLETRVGVVRRFGLSVAEQEQVWELWGTGKSLRGVARAMGCREQQLRRYVWWTGGVRPVRRGRAACGLSMAEREEISRGLARGDSCRQIAVDVERSHTTISREVNRNGGRKRYRAQTAEASAWQRASREAVQACPERAAARGR
jgi:hypothetical protein